MKQLSVKPLLTTLLIISAIFCAYSKKSSWDDEAAARKAAYLHIYGIDAFSQGKYTLYGELLDRAYQLDPSDPELQSRYGEWLTILNESDTAKVSRGFNMMLDAYSRREPDYFEGSQIAKLTAGARHWNQNLRISEKLYSQFPNRAEIALQLAGSYLVQAALTDTAYISKGLKVLSDLENRIGKSQTISEYKIRNYALKNDTLSIIGELQSLIADSPADSYTALAVGQVFNSLGLPDSAITYLNRACELDSANGNAILTRAKFYQQRGDSTTFDSEAFRAIKSQDLELEDKIGLMVNYVNMLYTDSTHYQRIDSMFEALLDVNPGEADVHRLYAEYFAHIGKHDRAAEQMNYVISLDPSDRSNWLYLANQLYSTSDYAKAAETLHEASKYFPNDFGIIQTEAVMFTLSENHQQAVETLENFDVETLTDPEDRSQYYTSLGDNYYKLNKRAKAFDAYDRAVSFDPTNYMAINNLAYYYAVADTLLDKAEEMMSRAIRHNDDNPTFLDTYAWVYYKKGDYSKAKEYIDLALSANDFYATEDSVDTILDDITPDKKPDKIESEIPQEELVVEEVVEAVESEPVGSAEIYDHAGDIYFRCGLINDAVYFWNKAVSLDPDNIEHIKQKIKHRNVNAP